MSSKLDNLEIREATYHLACVFISAEKLKEQGLITGGPEVDIEAMQEIIRVGEERGYAKPTPEQVAMILNAITSKSRK